MILQGHQTYEMQTLGFNVSIHKRSEPLRECVKDALANYFRQLDGHTPAGLYRMVISEVEQPLLQSVMEHTRGNQTRAAEILDISRSTLRKKLALYRLD